MTVFKGAPNAAPEPVIELIAVFCPKCGTAITHERTATGRKVALFGGAAAGALIGAKVGIVAGPFGAMAGTVPGALLGAIFGRSAGGTLDRVVCKRCHTAFELP